MAVKKYGNELINENVGGKIESNFPSLLHAIIIPIIVPIIKEIIREELQNLSESVWPDDQSARILEKAFKAAGVKVFKVKKRSSGVSQYFVQVKAVDGKTIIVVDINHMSNVAYIQDMTPVRLGQMKENPREIVKTLKKLKTLPGFGQSKLVKK